MFRSKGKQCNRDEWNTEEALRMAWTKISTTGSFNNGLISSLYAGSLYAALVTLLGFVVKDQSFRCHHHQTAGMNICCPHKLPLDNFPDVSESKPEYDLEDIEVLSRAGGQMKIIYLYSTDMLLNVYKLVQWSAYWRGGVLCINF